MLNFLFNNLLLHICNLCHHAIHTPFLTVSKVFVMYFVIIILYLIQPSCFSPACQRILLRVTGNF